MRDGAPERTASRVALGCVLFLAWLWARSQPYLGWFPHDEGVLGQSAERILRGELPHRDFVSLWSGGLDALHALIFRVFGTRLSHLRTLFLISWLGALAAMFTTVRKFLSPWVAAALCLAAAEWTVVMWALPMPSWYNLFLALAGTAAVARFLDTRRRGSLALAGAAAGSACAVKIVGLYFVAAIALFFVWQVQEETPPVAARRETGRVYAWTITFGVLTYLVLVGLLVFRLPGWAPAFHFVLPSAALVGLLTWREWRLPSDGDAARFRRLVAYVAPFLVGLLLVLAIYLAPYVAQGALGDLYTGLFVTPRVRYVVSSWDLPGLRSSGLAALAFAVFIAAAPFARQPLRRVDRAALWLTITVLAAVSYGGSLAFTVVWNGFRLMTPVCTLLGVWWLATNDVRHAIPAPRRSLVFFLVAAATTCSFVQIPMALYLYFLYFVPMLLLALAALVTTQPAMPRDVPAALLVFLLWFGFRNSGPELPTQRRDPAGMALLALPRGGISVPREDSAAFTDIARAVERHQPGDWIYVWHDAPQLYFLTGKRNPTRTMFEAFDTPVERSTAYLRDRLVRHDVRVVLLTGRNGAVRPMAPDFRAWIDSAFPGRERIAHVEVRWRDGPLVAR